MIDILTLLIQVPDPTPTFTSTSVYQPADPNLAKIMIGVALAAILIVLIGVWINR